MRALCQSGALGEKKTSEAHPIFQARTFCLVNKKFSFNLQITSQIDKKNEKVWVNTKYYRDY